MSKKVNNSESNPEHKEWTLEQEELLAEWSEKAACYRWLHNQSEKYYRVRNYAFTIPVIILSTLTGTANFAMDSFVPTEQKKMAMGIVGGVNIFAGILSTLQNFLRYAELMEAHRSISVSWSKFGRNISVELALDTKRRKHAGDFLKICRAEFDRLIEQAPSVDDSIIADFNRRFKDTEIIRPEICNGLHKCKIYKPTQEEKIASVLANAGGKLLTKRKDHLKSAKSWRRLDVEKPKVKKTSYSEPLQNVKEINEPEKTQETVSIQNVTIQIDEIKEEKNDIEVGEVKNDSEDLNEKKEIDNKDAELDEFIEGIDSQP